MVVPVFGALANFACMAFYVIGPIEGLGSSKEPIIAVVLSVVWGALRSDLLLAQLAQERQIDLDGKDCLTLIKKVQNLEAGCHEDGPPSFC